MNRIKDISYMIISIDAEKAFDKIQHIPWQKRSTYEGRSSIQYFNLKKISMQHSELTLYLMAKKKKTFSKIKSKTKMFILITSLQHEVLSKGSQARKGNKKYSDWKEEIILYLPML